MKDSMGDKWWTSRMFVLVVFLSVSCFVSGFWQGSTSGFAQGYTDGYTDCVEFVVNYINGIQAELKEAILE